MTFAVMGGGSQIDPRYVVPRSIRFVSSGGSSTNFSKTYASAGTSRTTYTLSMWLRRGTVAGTGGPVTNRLMTNSLNGDESFRFSSSGGADTFEWYTNGGTTALVYTGYSANGWQLRDTDAWYHVVCAVDTTQATAANRVRIYVNNFELTETQSVAVPLNQTLGVGAAGNLKFGTSIGEHYDGYMADLYYIDGQQLTPSSFAEVNTLTGAWAPKAYTGTYGLNGCHLLFNDTTSLATLFYDSSGNGNHYSGSVVSLTGSLATPSLESPTTSNVYGCGSFATFTYSQRNASSSYSFRDGSMTLMPSFTGYGNFNMSKTFGGRWYWEVTSSGGTTTTGVALMDDSASSPTTYTTTIGTGLTYGFRADMTVGTVEYTSDGTTWNTLTTGLTGSRGCVVVATTPTATTAYLNHGQRAFAYTMPSGYTTCSSVGFSNPGLVKAGIYYDVVGASGTGASRNVNNRGGFTPDIVWTMPSSATYAPTIVDSVRGISSNLTTSSNTGAFTDAQGVTSLNVGSVTYGTSANTNASGTSYATVMMQQTPSSGVHVATYTGTGTATTVAHDLGVVPSLIIVKRTDATGGDWVVWCDQLAAGDITILNGTTAKTTDTTVFTTTSATSSAFSVGTSASTNAAGGSYVAYVFANVNNYLRVGSYVGNGSTDGPYIFCGFRPAGWLLINVTGATARWFEAQRLAPNTWDNWAYKINAASTALNTWSSTYARGSGFKVVSTTGDFNTSGSTYIYMALADTPYRYTVAW